jgi:hypothetical protein
MSAVKIPRAKTLLVLALAFFCLAFAAQLVWLRQVGTVSGSPWYLGLFAAAPLGATAAFLGLWYLSLRGRHKHFALTGVPFWLVSTLCLAFWVAFYSMFVIGPAVDAAA